MRSQPPKRDQKQQLEQELKRGSTIVAAQQPSDKESPTTTTKPGGRRRAKILAITSGKGGVGKTSLSVNIGMEFAKRGYRTIVMDLDLGLANIPGRPRR